MCPGHTDGHSVRPISAATKPQSPGWAAVVLKVWWGALWRRGGGGGTVPDTASRDRTAFEPLDMAPGGVPGPPNCPTWGVASAIGTCLRLEQCGGWGHWSVPRQRASQRRPKQGTARTSPLITSIGSVGGGGGCLGFKLVSPKELVDSVVFGACKNRGFFFPA